MPRYDQQTALAADTFPAHLVSPANLTV